MLCWSSSNTSGYNKIQVFIEEVVWHLKAAVVGNESQEDAVGQNFTVLQSLFSGGRQRPYIAVEIGAMALLNSCPFLLDP